MAAVLPRNRPTVHEPCRASIRPKLDYLVIREAPRDEFVPFSNERDRLNRLLPTVAKSKSTVPSESAPPRPDPADYYISYNSSKLEKNQIIPRKTEVGETPGDAKAPKETLRLTMQRSTKFESILGQEAPVLPVPPSQPKSPDASKLIFRTGPIYSFSKTVQKSAIERAIEESRKRDYDSVDPNRAKDFLQKRGNFVPVYSKAPPGRARLQKAKADNHEYLVKLLAAGEDLQQVRGLSRAAAVVRDQPAAAPGDHRQDQGDQEAVLVG